MTDLLRLLCDRADVREPVYTADDIAAWPPDVFGQLVSAGILTDTANASAVVCDACAGDHVEEVIYVQSPSNTELRAYIRCPEAGRVFVPLDRLRRWEVNYRCVARLAASALSTSGEVEEVVPSCVWLLGKASLGSQRYEIFLGRRLSGSEVVQRAARLRALPQPVILVIGRLPDETIWDSDIPLVLPFSSLMSWDGARLSCDHAQLEIAAGKRRKAKTPGVTTLPRPDDGQPAIVDSSPTVEGRKPKRSTEPGEAREKIIAGLTEHHQYTEGSCLNTEPIGVGELARKAGVSKSTVSEFFRDEYKGHDKYRAVCRGSFELVTSLKILRGEFSPHILYGRNPLGEGAHDDE